MFNLSGSEIVVIVLLALVVLGPEKLPEALRKAGKTYAELKKMGSSFQSEMRSALDEPMKEMRETADLLRKSADLGGSQADEAPKPTPAADRAEQPVTTAGEFTAGSQEPAPGDEVEAEDEDGKTRLMALRRGPQRPKLKTPDDVMTLTDHLGELRVRIIRSVLAITLFAILIIAFYDPVLDFLMRPYEQLCQSKPVEFCGASIGADGQTQLFNFDPVEGLATRIRIGMYGGLILATPVVLWQVWQFIVPALHKREKRLAVPFILSSVLLFLIGGFLAYITLEKALEFLISWSGENVTQAFQVSRYVRLVMLMIGAFGIGLQFPILLVFLQLAGVLTPRQLVSNWRYALLAIVVIAAVITPSGDPISLAALAIPMTVLYIVSIGIGWIAQRRRREEPAAATP